MDGNQSCDLRGFKGSDMFNEKTHLQTAKRWIAKFARSAAIPVVMATSAGVFAACTAEVEPAVAPVGYYDSYPYTSYEGRTVYYVDGRWTYPVGNRWYYYRHVPSGLERRRTELHYPRGYGHGGGPRDHRHR
jgi:hypothetical protein